MSQSCSCDIPRMETWKLSKEGHDNSFLDISSYPQVVCIFTFLLYKMFKFLKLLDTTSRLAIWGEGRKGYQVQQLGGQSIKGWVKSSPAPRTDEFRGGSRVCKPEGPCNRSGGCWEHLTGLLPYVK